MSISEQIEVMITSLTDNNNPPQIITIKEAYTDNTVDIEHQNGTINKSIRASGRGVKGGKGLLTYENGDQNQPYIILFEDAETTINALGLGLFHIHDGNLYVELPNGITNPFSINSGKLYVSLSGNNDYEIKGKDLYYERWDY